MLNTSIEVSKSKSTLRQNAPQPSLFGAQLPLNIRLRRLALEQIEADFWALLEAQTNKAQTNKAQMRGHRQASSNFNRDFKRGVELGFTPADIVSSLIAALFEDQALISLYYPNKKTPGKAAKKKGGK